MWKIVDEIVTVCYNLYVCIFYIKLKKGTYIKMAEKRKYGDRSDGYRVRKLDPMHIFMPYLLPKRTDNEAVMNELVNMEKVLAFVEKKNADSPDFKYTMFHVICAAVAKTIAMRPKLNYYIINKRYYERNNISLAFTVKKQKKDNSSEALAIVKLDKDSDKSPLDEVYSQIKKIVCEVRLENKDDGATDIMGILTKIPPFVLKGVVGLLFFLDAHGWLPRALVGVDPYHCSAFLSNLGSIKMSASYHHLAEWGTNSFFAIVGELKKRPRYNDDGSFELIRALELGLTIDERIADGVYFINSMKLLKHLLDNPELLELPMNEKIEYDRS